MNLDEWAVRLRRELETEHRWRTLRPLAGSGRVVRSGSRELLCFSSNDYLGLASDPELTQAFAAGVDGSVGATASRLLCGTTPAHLEVEAALAAFVGREAALLFSSGYAANVGALPVLAQRGDLIVSDALNHASLIDGCRLSRAEVHVIPHGDLDAAHRILELERPRHRHAWLVCEGIYSMEGDASDLAGWRSIANRHDAWLYVDEAHSLGLLGPRGRGLCAAEGVHADLLIGTLGKSFGMAGAFAAGSRPVIEVLMNRARSFVFSTAPPPGFARALVRALQLVEEADDRRSRVLDHARELATGLRELDLAVGPVDGAIVPVLLGDAGAALVASSRLEEAGFLAQAVRPPTVPNGTSRLRLVPTAAHTDGDIQSLLEACGRSLVGLSE